jgi:uncharacterized membrane protein
MARLALLRQRARETLWLAPALGLLLALGLTVLTIQFDDTVEVGSSTLIGFDGGPDSARSILSTIAASMLTFLALVFTLTVVALQLASDFSPRLLRTFLSTTATKVALGLFVATFTYAVLVLREVDPDNVPELSVTIAIILVIVSVIAFVYYVSEVAQSLRVASIVERAGQGSRDEIERGILDRGGEAGEEETDRDLGWRAVEGAEPADVLTWEGQAGVVTAIDLDRMREIADRENAIIELRAQVGDFLPSGAPLAAVFGADPEVDTAELATAIATAKERTFHQDAAFGLRQLADVAARGLSPGINDPTTAVQALDQIHDILLRLGEGRLYSGVLRGPEGEVRVLVPVHSWDDYVHLSIDEIRIYGEGSMQVSRRLHALLEDLRDRLPACRTPAVERQLELLDESVERGFANETDRRRARLTTSAVGGSEGGG